MAERLRNRSPHGPGFWAGRGEPARGRSAGRRCPGRPGPRVVHGGSARRSRPRSTDRRRLHVAAAVQRGEHGHRGCPGGREARRRSAYMSSGRAGPYRLQASHAREGSGSFARGADRRMPRSSHASASRSGGASQVGAVGILGGEVGGVDDARERAPVAQREGALELDRRGAQARDRLGRGAVRPAVVRLPVSTSSRPSSRASGLWRQLSAGRRSRSTSERSPAVFQVPVSASGCGHRRLASSSTGRRSCRRRESRDRG
jgi:hypothetical protein